jgi:hypothetical protein
VAAAFKAENPAFVVIEVSSGEGDGSTVYKHIKYRRPGSAVACEVVWGYQEAEPSWRVFHRSQPRPTGPACEELAQKPSG